MKEELFLKGMIIIGVIGVLALTVALWFFAKDERVRKVAIGLLVGFMFVLVATVIYVFVAMHMFTGNPDPTIAANASLLGQTGDFFGGMLNPILAFASFIALLYTIKLQSQEMDETRKESQEAREEARLSRHQQAQAVVIAQENLQQQAAQEEFKFAMDLFVNRLHETDALLLSESRGLSVISFVNSAKVEWGDRDGAPVSREHLSQMYKNGHGVDDSVSARFVGLCNFLARDLHLVSTVATKLKMDNGKDSLLDLYTEKVAELCFFGACVDSRGNLTADYIKRNSLLNDKFKEYHAQNGFESPEVVAA